MSVTCIYIYLRKCIYIYLRNVFSTFASSHLYNSWDFLNINFKSPYFINWNSWSKKINLTSGIVISMKLVSFSGSHLLSHNFFKYSAYFILHLQNHHSQREKCLCLNVLVQKTPILLLMCLWLPQSRSEILLFNETMFCLFHRSL